MRTYGTLRLPKGLLGASAATLLTAAFTASGLMGGCTTHAIGVSECREIEYARCEASVPCGVVDDVEECKMFYRDQCLHGIAGDQLPTTAEQDACVSAITSAGACAEEDPEGSVSACAPDGGGGAGGAAPLDGSTTVCEFLAAPWDARVCDFLNEPPPEGGASG